MTSPVYFSTQAEFRKWLKANESTASEIVAGFHKVDSGRPSMTWPESVNEALCFGWIDGVRKRIDEHAYQIRFTPRKPTSIWSANNIAKYEKLSSEGRMTEAGTRAFAHRKDERSIVYAYEQETIAELSPLELKQFQRDKAAKKFFEATPPGYRKVTLYWLTSARKPETRKSRFKKLLDACRRGVRLR